MEANLPAGARRTGTDLALRSTWEEGTGRGQVSGLIDGMSTAPSHMTVHGCPSTTPGRGFRWELRTQASSGDRRKNQMCRSFTLHTAPEPGALSLCLSHRFSCLQDPVGPPEAAACLELFSCPQHYHTFRRQSMWSGKVKAGSQGSWGSAVDREGLGAGG